MIIEALLGLDDAVTVETALQLNDDGEFSMTRDKQVALIGNWHIINDALILTAEDQ
jgi:hypothetical protein